MGNLCLPNGGYVGRLQCHFQMLSKKK